MPNVIRCTLRRRRRGKKSIASTRKENPLPIVNPQDTLADDAPTADTPESPSEESPESAKKQQPATDTCAAPGDLVTKTQEECIALGRAALERPWERRTGVPGGCEKLVAPQELDVPYHVPEKYFDDYILKRVMQAPRRQLVIDVGANVGQWAISMSKAGIDSYNFEPGPATCKELKRNIAKAKTAQGHRGNMHVFCAAVGATKGVVKFAASKGRTTSFKIATSAEAGTAIEVPIVTLDDVIPRDGQIALLKTDTQGFEMGVLRGACGLLQQRRPRFLIIEMSYILLHSAGSSPKELMEFVRSFGYTCTHMAFHGRSSKGGFGTLSKPESLKDMSAIDFDAMQHILSSIGKKNLPGWTDLLCW